MSMKDWALFHEIAKREGLNAALYAYPGHLFCGPCDRNLPFEGQLLGHLGSVPHKEAMRKYIRANDPKAKIQERNWAHDKSPQRKRPGYQSGSRSADTRNSKRSTITNGRDRPSNANRVAWKCLGPMCSHVCLANKDANAYKCPKCHLMQPVLTL